MKIQNLQIREARVTDCEDILAINGQCHPHVAALERRDVLQLLPIASMTLVAVDAGAVLGYLLAFSSQDAYDGEEFLFFSSKTHPPFIFVDQVAVAVAVRNCGIASRMMRHAQQSAGNLGIFILGSNVNLEPPNAVSMAFHRKLGFEEIGDLRTSDGGLVALMGAKGNAGAGTLASA